jgi:YD repeat-containing protein
MFKQLGVDIQLPVATGTVTQFGDGTSFPTNSRINVYATYSNLAPVAGANGNISISAFPPNLTPSYVPSDVLYLAYFNPCPSGYSSFSTKATYVDISLPRKIRAQGQWGYCECPNGGVLSWDSGALFSGLIPLADPCPSQTCIQDTYDDDGNVTGSINTGAASWYRDYNASGFTGEDYQVARGIMANMSSTWIENESVEVVYTGNLDVYNDSYDVGIDGVTLTNITTEDSFYASFNAFSWDEPSYLTFHQTAGSFSFGPGSGTDIFITFPGWNRTTPGNYRLTWPLLKQPYTFTIPTT